MDKHKYGLYEQSGYDPLKWKFQECYDKFWLYPELTLEDVAKQAIPDDCLFDLRSRPVTFF